MDDARIVENLVYRYTELLDGGEWDAFGQLFDEGVWVVPGAEPGHDLELRGADATQYLRDNIRLYEDTRTPKTNHFTTNVHVEVDGDQATASSYFAVSQAVEPDFPFQPIFAGRYHDTFAKRDGVWRFARRTLVPVWAGDLSQHVIAR
jgi:hypothetical protein